MSFLLDDTIDTTNITNVLLIDKETSDYEVFYNSCNGPTFPIVYSRSCNRNDLLQLLNNKFTKIDRLGFVFSFQRDYTFLNDELLFRDDESIPYSENVVFIINLINQFSISIVDYLACDTLNYENWKNYYNIILSNTTAIVGASSDRTGNLKYGGDWTMESTGQDIELIYFNSNIQNYQHLLDVIGRFSLFVMSNNTIYGCGDDGGGALGTQTGNFVTNSSLVQMMNNTGKTPVSVTSGEQHTIVLMSDGTIFGCARNLEGQLGTGNNTGQPTIVQMTSIAGKTPSMVSCGGFFTIVLMTDGTIYGTGANGSGQLGNGGTSNRNTLGEMTPHLSGRTPVAISAGSAHTLVLMSDNTIFGTGSNMSGELGNGTTGSNSAMLTQMTNNTGKTPAFIYAASGSSFVLMTDGTIFGTGVNTSGQLGVGNTTNRSTLTQMTNNTGKIPIDIYCGFNFTMVLMSDRTIFGTGVNSSGQLGIGNTTNQSSLIQMTNNTGKTPFGMFAGYDHNMVLMSDGTVFGCGSNSNGQLGDGTTTNRSTLTLMNNNTGLSIKNLPGTRPKIYKSTPTISGFSISTRTFGNSAFTITPPTSNSNGSFSYSSSNTSVATISGNTITIVGAGTSTITATQAESTNYSSGTITTSFQVNKATPSITGFSISTRTFGNIPFTITQPTSNSNGSFSYSSSNTSVATISGNTITIVGAGTSTITATQAESTNYSSGTATASFQVAKATPSITGFSISTRTFGDNPFTITPPTSNSDGSFSYSSSNTSVATISGNTITIVGPGTTTITATQAEGTNYTSGTATASFQVTKITPTISGFSIPIKTYGDSAFTITTPTSNSDGLFSYSSSNTSVATISGNTITIVGAGTSTITATQAESTNYSSGTITTSFQVDKATPSITGFSIPTKTYGDSSFTIPPPTSNSDGSFTYSSSNTSVASISGNTITIVGPGTATITATQTATTNFNSGTATTSFQVSKATPSITGFSIPTKTYGDSSFTIPPPTSNNDGSFTYSSSNTSVASISGNTITIVGPGTATITATQTATTNYNSGTATTSFQVNKATPSITGFSISTKNYGDSSFTISPPTSNSDGLFTYSSSNTSVASISGNTITIVGVGTATITATQSETTNYTSITATTSFQVNKATPSITGFSISTKNYGDSSFTISPPTSNSDGSFTYTISNTSVASISGNTITIVGVGTATITATQTETINYTSGTATTSFQVNKATPIITGFSIPTKTYGDSSFTITPPTSNSEGSFTYSSSNTSVASISGNTITIVGVGTATITATQTETTNYSSGTITTLFQVSKATLSISGFSIPTKTYGDSSFTITPPISDSDGSFSYSSSNTSIATISGDTITIVGAGTTTITATQSETTNYTSRTITTSFQVSKATPSISGFSIPTKSPNEASFTIPPPTSNSDGLFSYSSSDSSVATISGNTITIVGPGITTITATQAETTNYTSRTITTSFQVSKITPSIDGFSIPIKTYGDSSFTITPPTSNSNGLFSYSSSNTSVATISGNTITIVSVGTATITATQAETTNYTSGTITASFQVSKATPSIDSFSIPTKTYGDSSFTITPPTSNSDGSFTYTTSNTSVATISGNTITIVGVGTTTITATQGETTNYTSGTITTSFQVSKATPIISSFSIPTKTYGDSSFTITPPTSNSEGSLSYSSSDFSVATISGNTITIVGAGTATITATQVETTNYTSETITTSFQVSKATPIISGFSIPTKTYGDSSFTITPPTSNSEGSFSYSSSNTSVATISGDTITIVGAGTTTITVTQTSTTNYNSGTTTSSFQVSKATPLIDGFSIPIKTYSDEPFTIPQPTSNSDGSFSYSSSNTSVATISGNTITIIGFGTAIITATQAETTNYTSGIVTTSFQVTKITTIIDGFSIPTKNYGDSSFTITPPTSNRAGSFSYSSSDTLVATISGNTITIIGPGTTTITATQIETTNYTSGTATASFQVTKITPTISGFSIPTKNYGDSSFTITPPTSNSDGSFSYSSSNTSVATISGNTITIVGGGTATITATQAETTFYASGTATASFQVSQANLSISGFSIPTKKYGNIPFIIPQPTSNSTGSFSYTSSNTSVASISGNTITITGIGTTTITATQAETTSYTSGTATTSFQVVKANPSISGFSIPTKTYGNAPFTIPQPTSNSNGPFSYSSSNTSVATISGNTITIVGVGSSTITAFQQGTTNYNSGTIISSFQVSNTIPSITNFSIPTKKYGNYPFVITPPTSNSTGSFTYISTDTSVATISGNGITIIGAGTTTIMAVQETTANYTSGIITTPFRVAKAIPSISNFSIPTKTYGDVPFTIPQPTSNSNGSFSYISTDTSVATISGNTITIVGSGITIIVAIQETTPNYSSGAIYTYLPITSL
jgi:alpha-tubulin suppressor-like RCC1 family protein